jgi:hypothetical protein
MPTMIMPAAVAILSITSVLLLLSWDWRLSVGALAFQYIGVTALVSSSWPLPMAATKLIAGWMAGSILALSMTGREEREPGHRPGLSGFLYRVFGVGIIGLAMFSVAGGMVTWITNLNYVQALGSLILIGMGLFHIGVVEEPFRAILGLLTIFSGFEIAYSAVESSILVSGLLTVVTLGLALTGGYLEVSPHVDRENIQE